MGGWKGLVFQKKIILIHRQCNKLTHAILHMNKGLTTDISRYDIIKERPYSHVSNGLLKVCLTFVICAAIGGYLGKNLALLLEELGMYEFEDSDEENSGEEYSIKNEFF